MAEGAIDRLQISSGTARASYRLAFLDGSEEVLDGLIGRGLVITPTGEVECRHCGAVGRRSFGQGYCYDCFTTLARCDLCVVSPDRCHYHQGTCREPEWGERFCMTPHRVYLANSSGIKVGITRRGGETRRWLDQGAIQGLPIFEAATRQAAGLMEVRIGALYPDRTDWRRMLRPDVPVLDLEAAARAIDEAGLKLPDGITPVDRTEAQELAYPLDRVPPRLEALALEDGSITGNLLGMKGQYLVLTSGVWNVSRYSGYLASVEVREPFENHAAHEQLGLF
jgi:hypothetical protein